MIIASPGNVLIQNTMHKNVLTLNMHASKNAPQHRRRTLRRRTLILVFLASLFPYLLPRDQQPAIYHDGVSFEEMHKKRLNKFVGGDIENIIW